MITDKDAGRLVCGCPACLAAYAVEKKAREAQPATPPKPAMPNMDLLQRYTCSDSYGMGTMDEDSDGEWVRLEDVQNALLAWSKL
jgi:hypothetical protein